MGLLGGCGVKLDLPQNFVEVASRHRGIYDLKAVSADGVVIALRTIDTPQGGTLEFWAKAITNELTGRGHRLDSSKPVVSKSGTDGRLMSFSKTISGQDFTYLLVVFVGPRRIVLPEAAGKAEAIKERQADIERSLLTAG